MIIKIKNFEMKEKLFLLLLLSLALDVNAQNWNPKDISFPIPSQGWWIRSTNENNAYTFGYSITEDENNPDFWSYTDMENSIQKTIDGGNTWQTLAFRLFESDPGYICIFMDLMRTPFLFAFMTMTTDPYCITLMMVVICGRGIMLV